MLAKIEGANQITLPEAVMSLVDSTGYFEVTEENGRIVLTPARAPQSQMVRDKLELLGVSEDEVGKAVAWARK